MQGHVRLKVIMPIERQWMVSYLTYPIWFCLQQTSFESNIVFLTTGGWVV